MSETLILQRLPRHRWMVCIMLFLATTSNYMDRQVLSILAPELQRELGWSEVEYGNIVTAFQAAYALGLLGCGWLIDRVGTRWGLIVAVAVWSLVSAAHGLARSVAQFSAARFALGLAEAGNFPASIKSVAEWFPKRERGLAIGFFNSGSNVGAILAPLLVPYIALRFGWQSAFYILGAFGFVWIVCALVCLRVPTTEERAVTHGDACRSEDQVACWRELLARREVWGFAAAKFLTDPVWWFYLYWTPKFLHSSFGIELVAIGAPLVAIYLLADAGSVVGGWWSGYLIRHGRPAQQARMYVLLRCAVAATLPLGVIYATEMWMAVALVGLATAAHQAWSANLFATVADSIPESSVGTVVGVGGMAGAVGGMLIAQFAGHVLELQGSYFTIFMVCCSMYLLAWGIMRLSYSSASQRP